MSSKLSDIRALVVNMFRRAEILERRLASAVVANVTGSCARASLVENLLEGERDRLEVEDRERVAQERRENLCVSSLSQMFTSIEYLSQDVKNHLNQSTKLLGFGSQSDPCGMS